MKPTETTLQWKLKTEIGNLYLVASRAGLQGIFWNPQKVKLVSELKGTSPVVKILAKADRQLRQYFAGKLKEFSLPLDLQGTDFQQKVWAALLEIPYGKTVSYQDIARKIKNPKAVRAVGSANGKNPVCIIVPCHRVIAANQTIGGYAGGLEMKRRLLVLENPAQQF